MVDTASMDVDLSSIFMNLPLDIFRLILEMSAELNQHEGTKLLRLSKEIHSWIEPVLYRNVVLMSDKAIISFAMYIWTSSRPLARLEGIKSICIVSEDIRNNSLHLDSAIRTITSSCRGLVSLNLWHSPWAEKTSLVSTANLKHLSIPFVYLEDLIRHPTKAYSSPWANITHLEIVLCQWFVFEDTGEVVRSLFQTLKQVTYFMFNALQIVEPVMQKKLPTIMDAIIHRPTTHPVELIILAVGPWECIKDDWVNGKRDPRVVFEYHNPVNLASTHKEKDVLAGIWEVAEHVVKGKLLG